MTPMDRLTALAQIWLAVMFLAFTFAVTIIYELGLAKLPPEQATFFAGHISWMQSACLVILYFFFQRARASSTPDPATTAISTTTTMTPAGGLPNAQPIAPAATPAQVPSLPLVPDLPRGAGGPDG